MAHAPERFSDGLRWVLKVLVPNKNTQHQNVRDGVWDVDYRDSVNAKEEWNPFFQHAIVDVPYTGVERERESG